MIFLFRKFQFSKVSRPFTIETLRNTACWPLNEALVENAGKVPQGKKEAANGQKKRNKTKEWIALTLKAWCEANGFELIPEFKFCESRKWRFDWFVPELNTGIEYEGLHSKKNGHTSEKGYTLNTDKYNEASKLGFRLIRVTALNHKTLFTHLEEIKEL